jgi:hypothetical protein
MGYDLHIVRGADYFENPAHQVSAGEWLRYIDSDPDLTLAGYNGPLFTLWSGTSENPEPWLERVLRNHGCHPDQYGIRHRLSNGGATINMRHYISSICSSANPLISP